jgi:hypothetical protein
MPCKEGPDSNNISKLNMLVMSDEDGEQASPVENSARGKSDNNTSSPVLEEGEKVAGGQDEDRLTSHSDQESDILRECKPIEVDVNNGSAFKQFMSIFGGAILISMACLDPGNIAADIDIANTSGLSSFWSLLLAHILCYFYQDASLSVAAGAKMDVATVGSKALNKSTSMTLWIMIELALIASDTQEILGAATSLQILFG